MMILWNILIERGVAVFCYLLPPRATPLLGLLLLTRVAVAEEREELRALFSLRTLTWFWREVVLDGVRLSRMLL